MVMFDSLNRHMLETYGCDWTLTPNFRRLAEHSVQFDNCYVGSMPCMPARRELHTGRLNFFHRSWGPLEPYDDSMPEILKKNGIYTHLVSDHQHYWEDGGCTYHTRYSSWEISRGQEGDPWKPSLGVQPCTDTVFKGAQQHLIQYPESVKSLAQDQTNRRYMARDEETSQGVTFENGLAFLERNHDQDNWFLQIETFDPHEPFYTLPSDRALYPRQFVGDAAEIAYDWPPYARVQEDAPTVERVRYNYAALLSKCDRNLGRVLDAMDRWNLWEDTMLIVNTDHGFLLGEHGWWGKSVMPIYDEIAHIPLYIYDPRRPNTVGVHRRSIVQTMDLPATLLEFFGQTIPANMEGQPLVQVMEDDTPIRDSAVFGFHGSQIDITDGRYLYMLAPAHTEEPVYEYTLMPTHMRQMFQPGELRDIVLAEPFQFTKGCRLMKIKKTETMGDTCSFGTLLFDLEGCSPDTPIHDEAVENQMKRRIRARMEQNDAPKELYYRMGLETL